MSEVNLINNMNNTNPNNSLIYGMQEIENKGNKVENIL